MIGAMVMVRTFQRRWPALLVLALLIPAACLGTVVREGTSRDTNAPIHEDVVAAVEHVRDGDTIDVSGFGSRLEAVRLIGVDTPETVKPGTKVQCWGPESSAYTKRLLPPGTVVTLKFERDSRGRGLRDRYKRLLAYVYKGRSFVNLRLVALGYAKAVYYSPNDDHRTLFEAAQREAATPGKDGRILGRWAHCGTAAAPTTTRPMSGGLATCARVKAAGKGPYRRGVDPEYARYEDRDGDGVVCE